MPASDRSTIPADDLRRKLVLVRPDDHIAAIASMRTANAIDLYRRIVGRGEPQG